MANHHRVERSSDVSTDPITQQEGAVWSDGCRLPQPQMHLADVLCLMTAKGKHLRTPAESVQSAGLQTGVCPLFARLCIGQKAFWPSVLAGLVHMQLRSCDALCYE